MEIEVKRSRQGKNSTLSALYIDGEQVCYVLEDSVRDEKIKGSTAIPAGRYKLAFRHYGRMHGRYHRLFPDFHKGMIQLMDVPNFSYIYIHMGNNFSDTAGCLLVGQKVKYFKKQKEYEIRQSRKAYVALYKRLAAAMEKGEVFIKIHELSSWGNELSS
ncbi:DUF5675 family protein [Sphingobacterium corticibacterium]|uniref:DUF5675 domain-containing protein n=1 Tax=Sphingobacterium corticibacterium TaxID=2484746 RepID=A0A4Q6XVR9_9SPHI|nr:DUF5675 family protein [Sphingobacterium corticibacterium]RZF61484.1 hypothetical protein EWE74_01170 [Sphingobacterium corticibacterium]